MGQSCGRTEEAVSHRNEVKGGDSSGRVEVGEEERRDTPNKCSVFGLWWRKLCTGAFAVSRAVILPVFSARLAKTSAAVAASA